MLDTAQEKIHLNGFTLMSFQGIATQVGITKPGLINDLHSKAALGVAVIQRYRETFAYQLEAVKVDLEKSALDALGFYFSSY